MLVVAAAMSLALVACGDADEPGAVTPTSSTSVAPTTTSTVVASTTTKPPAADTTTAPVTSDCATVGFTPNSEDAASSIKATGLSCAEAEAFVRVAGTRTSSGGPQTVNVEGYRCVLTSSTEDPLPTASYECTNGAKKVTFVRS